jgi:L-lactate dehydrogenase complex protein LldE
VAALASVEADALVCPSGSCAAFLRAHLAALLPDDPRAAAVAARTFELGEFLARRLGLTDVGARFPARVAWHDACHALRALGLHDEPRRLLGAVRGLELVEPPGAECCGFGGTFAVTHAEISTAIGEERAAALERTGADVIASSDPTCLLQLAGVLARRGWRGRALHLAEILAET